MTTSTDPFRVLCVVGARPNFMKIAPIMRAVEAEPAVQGILLHTGQHYDEAMKASFFEQLSIPEPDVDLGVGSASHALQTAEIMSRFEPELDRLCPGAVLVVGDVNSTIACALVAVKKGVPVIHVEAGLRSWDRSMPEEINRVLTDQISELLFTTEQDAARNLEREGIDPARIQFVGNVMIDTLLYNRPRATRPEDLLAALPGGERLLGENGCGLLTLTHRPSNVDDPDVLRGLLEVLCELSEDLPLVFPVHPRTRARIEAAGLVASLQKGLLAMPPLGYLDMLGLMGRTRLVLTDSGGIQEETTALGVPCITLRENTERPITVTEGTNTVVGTHPERIRAAFREVIDSGGKAGRVPELWDGHAAERIAAAIGGWAQGREARA
jgi:UDP-N-acetylglucosamine 2-epimerase (non-hydrolysing)